MDTPTVEHCPLGPADRLHLLLAERGTAILPEAGNADGRVTLTDAMLAVATLAACFALIRSSLVTGLTALTVVVPSLARTHAVMVRVRSLGAPSSVGTWVLAFASSAFRIGQILGLVGVIHAAGLIVGVSLGTRFLGAPALIGAFLGFTVLGIPLTLLALAYLIPRLLSVRDTL